MANIPFKGNPQTVAIPKKFADEGILVSVVVELEDDKIKIAGHSIVNLAGKASIEDVQFNDHELGAGTKIDGKTLAIIVNVSKFKIKKGKVEGESTVATCKVKFHVGDKLIKEFSLDDSSETEDNTRFVFVFAPILNP